MYLLILLLLLLSKKYQRLLTNIKSIYIAIAIAFAIASIINNNNFTKIYYIN